MPVRRLLCFHIFIFALAACAPLLTSTPPPTPQPLLVQRPLALQGWDDHLRTCAADFPQIALFIAEQGPQSTIAGSLNLKLFLGAPTQSSTEFFVLGTEELLLAANIRFPVAELSLMQLQDIYSGRATSSQDITADAEDFPLQAWTYLANDPARQVFEQASLLQQVRALIAPDPYAMLQALADQPGAVGYLPRSAFAAADESQKAQIKEIAFIEAPPDIFIQPVLVSFPSKPPDLLQAYLTCLQP